jgi:hypothetical protein
MGPGLYTVGLIIALMAVAVVSFCLCLWYIFVMPGRSPWKWRKLATLGSAFAITIYLTSYISRLPESNCTTSPFTVAWSDDLIYEAIMLKKDCNLGESIFYSVKIHKQPDQAGDYTDKSLKGERSSDLMQWTKSKGWFFVVNIEAEAYPGGPPTPPVMKWESHKLRIDIASNILSGSIELQQRQTGDLTVVRSYIDSAKPNP